MAFFTFRDKPIEYDERAQREVDALRDEFDKLTEIVRVNGGYAMKVKDPETGDVLATLPLRVSGFDPVKDAERRKKRLAKQQRKQRERELVG